MTGQEAMVTDWVGALRGVAVLSLYLFGPGYLVGRLTGVAGFAGAGLLERMAAGVCLSVAIVPVLADLAARLSLTLAVFALGAVGLLGLLAAIWDARRTDRQGLGAALVMAAVWTVVAVFSVSDLAAEGKLYFSTLAVDHGLRIGTVHSLAHQLKMPPVDPFLRPDLGIPLGYHYFWFLLSSFACRLTGDWVSARGALHGSVVWAGFGLVSLLFLWLRRMRDCSVGRCIAIAVLVLAVSGLDLVGYLIWSWREGVLFPAPTLGWWNPDELTAWVDLLLWTPHCVASLIAGGFGLLLLLGQRGERPLLAGLVVAGMSFASAAGLAIYVCFGLGVCIAWWGARLVVRRNWLEFRGLVIAGGVAALLALPYLLDLAKAASGAPFATIGLRKGSLPGLVLGDVVPFWLRLPMDLPVTLLFETGFFAWAWWYWRKREPEHPERWLLAILLWVSLGCTVLLRSDAVGTNDLAMRAVVPAQFALTVAAGTLLLRGERLGRFPAVLLGLGLLGTLGELLLLRTATLLPERGMAVKRLLFPDAAPLGPVTRDMRSAYAFAATAAPFNTLVQHNPAIDVDSFSSLYNQQRVRVSGLYQLRYRSRYRDLIEQEVAGWAPVFAGRQAPVSHKGERYYLLVKSTDWVEGSWMEQWKPVFSSESVKLFAVEAAGPLE